MPLLFLERFPWPSLRTYTALSALALLGTGLSAYRALSQAPGGAQPDSEAADTASVEPLRRGGPRALDVAYYLFSDSLCVWVSAAGRAAAGPAGPAGWVADWARWSGAAGPAAWPGVAGPACGGTSPRLAAGGGGRATEGLVSLLRFDGCSQNREGAPGPLGEERREPPARLPPSGVPRPPRAGLKPSARHVQLGACACP